MATHYTTNDKVYKSFIELKNIINKEKDANPFNRAWRDHDEYVEHVKSVLLESNIFLSDTINFVVHRPTAREYFGANLQAIAEIFVSSNNCTYMTTNWKKWFNNTVRPAAERNQSRDFGDKIRNKAVNRVDERQRKRREEGRKTANAKGYAYKRLSGDGRVIDDTTYQKVQKRIAAEQNAKENNNK